MCSESEVERDASVVLDLDELSTILEGEVEEVEVEWDLAFRDLLTSDANLDLLLIVVIVLIISGLNEVVHLESRGIWEPSVGFGSRVISIGLHGVGIWLPLLLASHFIGWLSGLVSSKHWALLVKLKSALVRQSGVCNVGLLNAEVLEVLSPSLPLLFASHVSGEFSLLIELEG